MTPEEFDTLNGPCLLINGVLVYANGARRDNRPGGKMFDPPTDLEERHLWRLRYADEWVQRATAKYNELQRNLSNQIHRARQTAESASPTSPPTDEQFRELEVAKDSLARVTRARDELKQESDEELATSPGAERKKRAAAAMQGRLKQIESAAQRLQTITQSKEE